MGSLYQPNSPPTATLLGVFPENIPAELKRRRQWVNWRLEERDNGPTKVPYTPNTDKRASSTDSETWRTFEEALTALGGSGGRRSCDGLGFVFSSGDPYTGIDLDHCRALDTGEVASWAWEWVERFGSYVEVSPSGDGLHIIAKGKSPRSGKKTVDGKTVEVYSDRRFFTVTGRKP